MEALAFAILLSTILYLVDKNHQWAKFWRILKWGALGLAVAAGIALGYSRYESARAANHGPWENYDPSKLPPGYTLDKPQKESSLN